MTVVSVNPLMGPAVLIAVDRKEKFTLFEGHAVNPDVPDPARMVGASVSDIEEHHPVLAGCLRRALRGETFTELVRLNNTECAIHFTAVRTANGKVSGAIGVALRALAAEQGKDTSDLMLDALFRVTTDVILFLDADGRYVDVAPTNPSLLYRPADHLIGRTLHEVFPQDQASTFLNAIRDALAQHKTIRLEHSLPIGGKDLWFSAAIAPMSERQVVWFARDITEQRDHDMALRESEERYRRLFDNIGDICFVIDDKWRYLHVNQAASQISRLKGTEIVGHEVSELIPDLHAVSHFQAYRMAMDSRQPRSFTAEKLLLPESLLGVFEVFLHPVAEGIMCIAHDITARAMAEEALKRSEERYHTLFEESNEPQFINALDGSIIDFNQAMLDLFGYTRAEIMGISAADLYVNPNEHDRLVKTLEQQGTVRDFAVQLRRKSGMVMDCLVTATLRHTADGKIEGHQGMIRDITAQKLAADALRESEARFRAIFEGTTFGIAVLDLTGHPLLVNPALAGMFAYTADELRAMSLRELLHPADRESEWDQFKSLARGERDHYQAESRCVTRIDQTLWTRFTLSLVWDASNQPVYIVWLVEDITETQQAVENLRESEERYRRLVEFAPEPIAVHADGVLVYLNKACARLLGAQEPDELLGKPVIDFVHPDYRQLVIGRIEQTQTDGKTAPLVREKFIRTDGALVDVEVVAIPIDYHGRRASQILIHDITEQMRAQENERALADALRRSATALNSTLDLNEVLSLILSSVGQVVPHDSATIMLVEGDTARVVGHHGWRERGLDETVHSFRFKVADIPNFRRMAETSQPILVGDLQGDPAWVKMPHTEWIRSYAGAPIVIEGETIGFINLESAEPHYFTEEHGERLLTFAEHAAIAIRNARLYADLRRHAAELEARNHDLDAFTHTVAHDLKAPLHIILGYASLLLADETRQFDQDTLDQLRNIEEYSRKLDTMIESLLLLARLRNQEIQAEPTDMKSLAQAALKRFDDRVKERRVTIDLAPDIPPALAYGPWIEEVFANLVENAVKYLGADNLAPHIAVRGERISSSLCRYEIEDNGIGIAREHHKDLFKMFTRIQPGHIRGAGLGLSIVERIITKLGGEVGVESELGRGSIFWFTLPAANQAPGQPLA